MLQIHSGRISWRGTGRGLPNIQSSYTIHAFDRGSGFEVCQELRTATHELYIVKTIPETAPPSTVLFHSQYDFRLPGHNPKSIATWTVETLAIVLQKSVPLSMVACLKPNDRGFAAADQISLYWAKQVQIASEALLVQTLKQYGISRKLYELDREFYLRAYPY